MEAQKVRADKDGRVTLFRDFADQMVVIERVSENELRIIKTRAVLKRYSLNELLKRITPDTLHGEIDTGPTREKGRIVR